MRIRILSDLHLEFAPLELGPVECDLVILAGDIHAKQYGVEWAKNTFSCPVVYVPGNHEYYGSRLGHTVRKLKEKTAGTRVHVLDNDVFQLGDLRVLGTTLWTDYRLTGNQPLAEWDAMQALADFKHIRNRHHKKIHPFDILEEHQKAKNFLYDQLEVPFAGKTVVVSHHAPSVLSIHERYLGRTTHESAAFASNLDAMMGGDRVSLWVHGHTHDSFDYDLYGTRIVCNPRGYGPDALNGGFNPSKVLDV
jgi:predicted phosphodiesterase